MAEERRQPLRLAGSAPGEVSPCPLGVCDGSGWILGPEDVARPCECRERRQARRRSRGVSSTIPQRYRGVSFDRPPVSDMARDRSLLPAVEAVRDFTKAIEERLDDGSGIWLLGDVGTGKTTLAMLVSKTAVEAGRSVAIYSLPRLLARIRRTYDAEVGEDSYLQFFERLVSVDLLHIDDLGAEKRSDWVLEQLYAIVDARYEAQRSMIVTMNVEERTNAEDSDVDWMTELEAQIGKRTVSRLTQMCEAVRVHGDDMRYKVA